MFIVVREINKKLAPGSSPVVHNSEYVAVEEAKRLARVSSGKYHVFKLMGTAEAVDVLYTEFEV